MLLGARKVQSAVLGARPMVQSRQVQSRQVQSERAAALAAASSLPPRMAAHEAALLAKRQAQVLEMSAAWPGLFGGEKRRARPTPQLRPSSSVPQLSASRRPDVSPSLAPFELERPAPAIDLQARASALGREVATLRADNAALRRQMSGRPAPPPPATAALLQRAVAAAERAAVDDARRAAPRKPSEARDAEWSAEAWLGSAGLHGIVARHLVARLRERSAGADLERPFVEALGAAEGSAVFEGLAHEMPLTEALADAIWERARELDPG